MMGGLFKFLQDILNFVGPQLLKYVSLAYIVINTGLSKGMIVYRLMIQFTKDETQPDWHGYFYTVLFFINALILSLTLHQYFHRVNLTGMRIRTAVIAAVYNKVN